jgi:hypothetical protein
VGPAAPEHLALESDDSQRPKAGADHSGISILECEQSVVTDPVRPGREPRGAGWSYNPGTAVDAASRGDSMIKQLWLFAIAVIAAVVGTGLSFERAWFVLTADRVDGTIVAIDAADSRCGGKHSYDCTKFTAKVRFEPKGKGSSYTSVSAGNVGGHGQSASMATRKVGARVPVLYDDGDPSEACENTVMAVWGWPLGAFGISGLLAVSSLFEPRRRRSLFG